MNKVLIKRGLKADLPEHLPLGEPAFCIDTGELFIGMGEGEPLKPIVDGDLVNRVANKFDDVTVEESEDAEEPGSILKFWSNGEIKKEILVKGGGGGGGALIPTITSQFGNATEDETVREYSGTTDEEIVIEYFFNTPNIGTGNVTCVLADSKGGVIKTEDKQIKMGKNSFALPVLAKGRYIVTITVVDNAGSHSYPLTINITIGSLEVIPKFSFDTDLSITDEIRLDYEIDSANNKPITVERTFNGQTEIIENVRKGEFTWNLGTRPKGKYSVVIRAYTEDAESNVVKGDIVVLDAQSLFVTFTDVPEQAEVGKTLRLSYRISMRGETKFNAYLYHNDRFVEPIRKANLGVNFWDIDDLEEGRHTFKVKVTTINLADPEDVIHSNDDCVLELDVVSSDYQPIRGVESGLLAWFEASDNANDYSTRSVWSSRKGSVSGAKIDLYNFNYQSNGWLQEGSRKFLKCNGETYGVMNMSPFANNITEGFTFDILFRSRNVGDTNGRVFSCESLKLPYNGIYADTKHLVGSSFTQTVKSAYSEDTWTRMTYTVDRRNLRTILYINGVISEVNILQNFGNVLENFQHDEKVYINCKYVGGTTKFDYFGNCEIKNIRLYGRALDHEEVVQNFISDFEDIDEQKRLYELSYGQVLPVMHFYGDVSAMSKETKVPLRIKYLPTPGYGEPFDLPECSVNWQGTSTLAYAVKNYKIRLRDELGGKYKYAPLENWKPDSTFTLKADYMESSHMNNTGTAKFVNGMYNEPLPPQVDDPDIRSAIDGFPMLLYINDQLAGTYMFNIDKGSDANFGFDKKNPLCLSYECSANSDESAGAFNDDSMASICADFEVRFPESRENDTEHPELQRLISWVKNATDEQFRNEIHQYLNLHYTIAYFVQVFTFAMVDNLGKNMMLNTWDGQIWYPTFYDMDTMLGLTNTGNLVIPAHAEIKEGYFNTSQSQLWTKLQRNFKAEIQERYREMRESAYTYENIMRIYEGEIAGRIGARYYNLDMESKYFPFGTEYIHMCHGNRLEHFKQWVKDRLLFCDTYFEYDKYTKSTVTFRCNKAGDITFRLKTYSPQYVTVKFRNTGASTEGDDGTQVRKLVSSDGYTEFTGRVTTNTDQEIIITNAEHLMEIDGIHRINTSFVNIGNATKLTKINCANSTKLKSLQLSNNKMLQKVDVSNCPILGTETSTLNVSKCDNLKELNCSGTQIRSILFNPDGGAFKKINASNSHLTEFIISNQEFLNEINLEGCSNLATFSVDNCNNLTEISMPNTKVSAFTIRNCDKIVTLNLSNNSFLETLDLDGCPNLRTLNLSGTNSYRLTNLDVSNSINLVSLDISKCSYLNYVTFPSNFNKLTTFKCRESVIKAIKFGRYSEMPDYLDLSNFNLSSTDFYGCVGVTEIRNINFTGSGNIFQGCVNLRKITGNMKFVGSMNSAFHNCQNLTSLPTLDLTETTSSSSAFYNCDKLTSNQIREIMHLFTDKLKTANGMFENCSNLSTIPSDLFRNATGLTNINHIFYNCGNLVGPIPSELMYPLENVVNATGVFLDCYKLTGTLDGNYFSCNTKLQTVNSYFEDTLISGSIPENLFANNPSINNVTSLFLGCKKLTGSIPPTLLHGLTNLKSTNSLFYNCSGLTGSIPEEFFHINRRDGIVEDSSITNVNSTFRGCSSLTGSIPPNLLDYTPNLQYAEHLFMGCTRLTDSIPATLLEDKDKLMSCQYLFSDCTGLSGKLPPNLLRNKPILTNITRMFNNCSGIISEIPEGFLDECPELLYIGGLFSGCSSLYGQIPETLFDNTGELVEAYALFNGCSSLVSTIPANIFKNCKNVTDLSNVFNGCTRLYGKIPNDLIKNCSALTNFNSAFANCETIKGRDGSDTHSYFIDPDFFSGNPKLTNLSSAFYRCFALEGRIPEELFENNPKLETVNGLWQYVGSIKGEIPANLFYNNRNLTTVAHTFYGCGGLTYLPSDMFANSRNIKSFRECFMGCNNLTGYANEVWVTHSGADLYRCYHNCKKLSNYDEIPDNCKI